MEKSISTTEECWISPWETVITFQLFFIGFSRMDSYQSGIPQGWAYILRLGNRDKIHISIWTSAQPGPWCRTVKSFPLVLNWAIRSKTKWMIPSNPSSNSYNWILDSRSRVWLVLERISAELVVMLEATCFCVRCSLDGRFKATCLAWISA